MVYFAREPDQQDGMARLMESRSLAKEDNIEQHILDAMISTQSELGIGNFRPRVERDPIKEPSRGAYIGFFSVASLYASLHDIYITVNGNCLPCCISPFATHHYG